MKTKLSTKGQVVIPRPILQKFGIRFGDALEVKVESGSIVLTPRKRSIRKARIVTDPKTGFPVLTAGRNAPILTSEEVQDILGNYP